MLKIGQVVIIRQRPTENGDTFNPIILSLNLGNINLHYKHILINKGDSKMILQQVEKHIIKKNHPYYNMFCEFTHQSKNLYNHANYLVRKEFVESGKWIRYQQLDKLLKQDVE